MTSKERVLTTFANQEADRVPINYSANPTDAEFAETEEVVRSVQFDSAFIFKYSERQGTIAAKLWEDDVPDTVKSERVTHLVGVQREISLRRHQALVGQTVRVLIEGESRKNSAEWKARTDGNMIVVFPDPCHRLGDLCDVRITEATPNTLLGIPAQEPLSN